MKVFLEILSTNTKQKPEWNVEIDIAIIPRVGELVNLSNMLTDEQEEWLENHTEDFDLLYLIDSIHLNKDKEGFYYRVFMTGDY